MIKGSRFNVQSPKTEILSIHITGKRQIHPKQKDYKFICHLIYFDFILTPRFYRGAEIINTPPQVFRVLTRKSVLQFEFLSVEIFYFCRKQEDLYMDNDIIIKEVLLNAPVSKVWRAIVDSSEMKNWYFGIPGFKAETGFEFQFSGGTEENQYLHLCKIMEVVPERKISYSWRYENYPGSSIVTFELIPEGNKTRVKLTHEGVETFPKDNSDFAKKNFTAGWNEIIGASLKNYFEKQ